MNLQERLQTELIGKDYSDEYIDSLSGMEKVEPAVCNNQRELQRKRIPRLAATIAADLKGPVSPGYTDHSCTDEVCVECIKTRVIRERDAEWHDAIARYCGVEGEK